MKEDFIQFIWNQQYFDKNQLVTSSGDKISILHPGFINSNAGPDFSNARIKIKEIEWVGNVEVHYKSSAWHQHKHSGNKAYDNVILHVVWSDDKPVMREDASLIPTLELKSRINPSIIEQYRQFLNNTDNIVCQPLFAEVSEISKIFMLGKAGIQRLERRASRILQLFHDSQNDWDQTAFFLLAENFGFKLNSVAFARLSHALPLRLLLKHKNNLLQTESLLFGCAGLLHAEFKDKYPQRLSKEYQFLQHKYKLASAELSSAEWRFFKTRPANFPTIRLSQFAAFIHRSNSIFSCLLDLADLPALYQLFTVEASDYWASHYVFDKQSTTSTTCIGKESIHNIAINTVIPLMVAYSQYKNEPAVMERALLLMEKLPIEKNTIIAHWQRLRLPIANGGESQAALELYNEFCLKKACLKCLIGCEIIKAGATAMA